MKRYVDKNMVEAAKMYEYECAKVIKAYFENKVGIPCVVKHFDGDSDTNMKKHTDFTFSVKGKEYSVDVKGFSEEKNASPMRYLLCRYVNYPNLATWLFSRHTDFIAFFTTDSILIVRRSKLAEYAEANKSKWFKSKYGDHDLQCSMPVSEIERIARNGNGMILSRNAKQ